MKFQRFLISNARKAGEYIILLGAGTACLTYGVNVQTGILAYFASFFFSLILQRTSIVIATLSGAIAGGIYASYAYHWISRFESPTPYRLTVAVNIFVFALTFAIASVLMRRYRKSTYIAIFALAIPFYFIRTVVHYLPVFPFAKAFLTVVNTPTVFDWLLPYFGASVTDVLTIATGGLLALIATQIAHKKLQSATVLYAILFAGIAVISPYVRAHRVRADSGRPSVKAALIQGNFEWTWDVRVRNTQQMVEYFITESRHAAQQGAKIIIWPEYAVPMDIIHENTYISEQIARLSHDLDATIVLGSMEITGPPRPDGKWNGYDLSLVYDPRKILMEPYRAVFPFTDNVLSGDKPVIYESTYGTFPVISCFEVANHKFVGDYARTATPIDFYIGIANIQLFDGTHGHARISNHLRRIAAENGKYFIYVANTGPSAVYDRSGDVVTTLETGKRASLIIDIPKVPEKTLYGTLQEIPAVLILGIAMVGAARAARPHTSHRKNRTN